MFRRSLLGLLLLWPTLAWAAPDTTLSIAPVATSGGRILASDENDRNTDISTWANAHDHNDIDDLANTVDLGDGSAGNKTLTANAADSSDLSLRFNDTLNSWQIEITSGTFNNIASVTASSMISGGIVYADGANGALASLAVMTNGQLLIGDGSGPPTAATVTDGAAIDTTNGAGTLTVAFDGDEVGSGSDPALSSCGTSPAITGNDHAGRIVVGTGSTTTCTATFNTAFASTPMCLLQNESSLSTHMRVATVAASFTITADQNLAGQFISYHCFGLD